MINRVYTIHRGYYKRKSYPNPHIYTVVYASPSLGYDGVIETYKNGNGVYTIHGGLYKRKSYLNPHIDPIFYASPRLGDARLIVISIIHLILPPQQT